MMLRQPGQPATVHVHTPLASFGRSTDQRDKMAGWLQRCEEHGITARHQEVDAADGPWMTVYL